MHRRRLYLAAGVLGLLCVMAGCKEDTPTSLGAPLRTAPDTLHSVDLEVAVIDTVFPIPVSLGRSPTGQIGQRGPYTAHVLYALEVPTSVVVAPDTFGLDSGNLTIELASTLGDAPFSGVLRVGLNEVQPDQRGWSTDSILTQLPALTAAAVAPDVTVDSGTFDADTQLLFNLNLSNFVDYDSVRAAGDSLTINVAVQFRAFNSGGPGFLEYPFRSTSQVLTAVFNGFSIDEPSGAILTSRPLRQLGVVVFDSTYAAPGRWLVSDGYRQHTWVVFDSVSAALPDEAFVQRADFVLTMVDSTDGLVFGTGPSLGVMVPTDTSQVFTLAQNTLGLSFSTSIASLPGSQLSINLTAYVLDQQEGTVPNTGMILRLSNEGTKARHFEFYGPGAADPAQRPRIRIIYGLPADFGAQP